MYFHKVKFKNIFIMKKITLKGALLFVVMGACFAGFSQQKQRQNTSVQTSFDLTEENQQHFDETGIVRCASVEYQNKIRKQNPRKISDTQFEQWLAPHVSNYKARIAAGERMAITTIPIIFHVFTDCEGADNVSSTLIQAQLDQLNIDFADTAGSLFAQSADSEIRFAFAQVDPSGNILPEPGINRVTSYGEGPFANGDVDAILKPGTSWDPNSYMNVWVANITGGLLGWAQFPDPVGSGLSGLGVGDVGAVGAANTDGVVVLSSSVGSVANPNPAGGSYPAGRTLTHEIGHWLGLRHLWGDGNCSVDDFCTDTPNCDSQYYGVGPGPVQCGNTRMIENYMDYSDDVAMNTFTADQKARIQAIMGVSPRRVELVTSTAANSAAPVVFFDGCSTAYNITEGSGCGFQDITIQIGKSKASTGVETVTVNKSGTATDNIDYTIQTPSLNFAAGSTVKQDFTIRIFEDDFVEANETIVLDLNVSTAGNATTTNIANQITITILNDDSVVTTISNNTLFSDDFSDGDASDWSILDNNSETADDWSLVEETDFPAPFGIYTDFFMASYSWNGSPYFPDNFLSTPLISIPAGATNVQLSYLAGSGSDVTYYNENYEVWVSTSISSSANILAGTRIKDENLNAFLSTAGGQTRTASLVGFDGQDVYVSFRHHDSTNEWIIGIDNVELTADLLTGVQTTVNTGTPDQDVLSVSGTVYTSNAADGNVMADITNNNAVNYGCVSTNVSRASGTSVMYQVAGVSNYVMGKTFTITPLSVQTGGNATVKFYFTEAEIIEWETTTGNNRSTLTIIKDNGVAEIAVATLGTFGLNVALEATFASGINGTYYFGKTEAVLGITQNQFNVFNVYPNPSFGKITLSLSTSENVSVSLLDIRGRRVCTELYSNNSDVFTTELDFSTLASGLYMLNVESGAKKAIKKIVIQ